MTEQYFSPEQASEHAKAWCKKHKGWKRICDIPNSDALYYSWDELPARDRKRWERAFGEYLAKDIWQETVEKTCKVPFGFISGAGEFYKNVTDIPFGHNLMMVFKV